jgi:hypothetical protein
VAVDRECRGRWPEFALLWPLEFRVSVPKAV